MATLSKTVKFDDDVIDVLYRMTFDQSNGSTIGVLSEQLERGLYVRTNKAIELLGGKWNRKAGGHVFASDPREALQSLIENGSLRVERDGFFQTPRPVVENMIKLVPFSPEHSILEPSAGLGAIAQVLKEHGASIDNLKLIEKNEQRVSELRRMLFYADCTDFLTYNVAGWDRIYMNPPFEILQDVDHVMHAFNLLGEKGKLAAIMCESAFFSNSNKATEFRFWFGNIVHGRSIQLPFDAFKSSGTMVKTRLVTIER